MKRIAFIIFFFLPFLCHAQITISGLHTVTLGGTPVHGGGGGGGGGGGTPTVSVDTSAEHIIYESIIDKDADTRRPVMEVDNITGPLTFNLNGTISGYSYTVIFDRTASQPITFNGTSTVIIPGSGPFSAICTNTGGTITWH